MLRGLRTVERLVAGLHVIELQNTFSNYDFQRDVKCSAENTQTPSEPGQERSYPREDVTGGMFCKNPAGHPNRQLTARADVTSAGYE